ncbi:FAD-binding oxidoreductase [Conchiformibius steedae DSM 2580]|uniref:FAD-binding oxidoreductase n=1 Tax=Conchiformibius steedae DSM 2580 TaxID=1121352 RepID=A0AAE9HXC4_9NEIS|nr:FAD-binding oxidoreductase [Conchiformibius steedae]QMT32943.1 FAD-binding oxidoreductase [Conchiformibius steedae]URD67565.1 FAD-binding oxidoreductase [Conchiformibius steedae DSM 2580]
MSPNALKKALQNLLVAPHELLGDADAQALFIDQRRRYHSQNAIALMPDSVAGVQKIMRFCHENHISVTPQGGNTGLVGGSVAQGGVLLNLSRLNQIRRINLPDNAITVEAGCVLAQVQNAAAEAGRLFPLSLASEGSCQIGGNIACNAGGLNVLRYGTMRDLVLGLEVVLADGTLVSHLEPLHKNTTGYEIKHLFIGSEGTLGVITAATLKLFPQLRSIATAWVGVENINQAIALLISVRNAFAERLISCELVSHFALDLSSRFSQISQPIDAEWHILIELSDSLPDIPLDEYLGEHLYHHGFHHTVLAQSEQQRQDLWTLRENISAAQRGLGVSIKHDIAIPIERVTEFIQQCGQALNTAFPQIQIVVFGHLGDGSLHYNTFLSNVLDNRAYESENAVNQIVYQYVLACGGTIAAEHGIGSLKAHHLNSVRLPAEVALMRAIKAQLDPHSILNPNVLLPKEN